MSMAKILVVDDEPFNLDIVAEYLDGMDFELVMVESGEAAWAEEVGGGHAGGHPGAAQRAGAGDFARGVGASASQIRNARELRIRERHANARTARGVDAVLPGRLGGIHDLQPVDVLDRPALDLSCQRVAVFQHIELEVRPPPQAGGKARAARRAGRCGRWWRCAWAAHGANCRSRR
mgnify:CR=1 FL=1